MFTGIVQKIGKIKKIKGYTFTITSDLNLENLDIGGSIALNGACLTITSIENKSFSIQVTPETLKRTKITPDKNSIYLTIKTETKLMSYICEKGYVAVDGVSLTIVNCTDDEFTVSIIPHTKKNTVFSVNKLGDIVNIEVDIISKYVEKLIKKK